MKWLQGLDKIGLGLYVLICAFAIINIYSVDASKQLGLGQKQLIFFGVSCVVGVVIFIIRSNFFENFAGIFYIGCVLLLLGLFPFGTEILGQKNWYRFGGLTMQPVEFAKIGTALMLANYLSSPDFNIKNKRSVYMAVGIVAVPAVVTLAIPDVGSVLVFGAFFIALFREGFSGWIFGAVFILAAVFLLSLAVNPWYITAAIVLVSALYLVRNFRRMSWNIFSRLSIFGGIIGLCLISLGAPTILEKMPKHQRERIEVLFKGERAFRDTSGYNLLYSKTAIGSGGIWGKGYKLGSVTQGSFVPEQETDYIFCTVGEEWGFVGSVALLLAYAFYIARIYYLAETMKSAFARVFGYSFASVLLMHFTINLGMVMGLFPTVGIPLPYFSYGGSSLLAFSIMTFIFFKLNYRDKTSLV